VAFKAPIEHQRIGSEVDMRVALIAPPMIAVPPAHYGGTELFVAHLAKALEELGVEVVVYANAESTVRVKRRSIYKRSEWPIKDAENAWIRELNHTSWAVADARDCCDAIHLQSAQGVTFSRFTNCPLVLTLHRPHDPKLSELYSLFPEVHYVSISTAQGREETMPRLHTIHHGIDLAQYRLVEQKQQYLSFLGRITPLKGTHIAIDVAKRTGIPLKIAGEIQPVDREYFERKIKPHIDGKLVEYIGLADLAAKNELLGNSMAMLFPIQWNEPFGLAMVEAMACGTPVLALPGGSVPEIVQSGVSGYICRSVVEMAKQARNLHLSPGAVRKYVEEHFSTSRMARAYLKVYQAAIQGEATEKAA